MEVPDLWGDLHSHTRDSDGTADDAAMAAARALGHRYPGVPNHSPVRVVARGQRVARLRARRREIDRLNSDGPDGFRILQGPEVESVEDGRLADPDDVLPEWEFCVASAHQAQGQDGAGASPRPCSGRWGIRPWTGSATPPTSACRRGRPGGGGAPG